VGVTTKLIPEWIQPVQEGQKMKSLKMLVAVAIVGLLVGASGTAMARNDCPDGTIHGGTWEEIVIDEFQSCKIVGAIVNGDILIFNADQIILLNNGVTGHIVVSNVVSAAIIDNSVANGDLVARGNRFSTVVRNIVTGGNIRVRDDFCAQQQVATVVQNLVFVGNMRVDCNDKADVKDNKVTNGDITCSDNDRLDSTGNDAFGGLVKCSKSLFQ
jgi:hypothetical protein